MLFVGPPTHELRFFALRNPTLSKLNNLSDLDVIKSFKATVSEIQDILA